MAPRGRPRKRDSRLDAALDAMSPYGFSEELVKKTVGELLNVYGGDDGWIFIEEAAYTLLIETMLQKQNNGAQDEDKSCQDDQRDVAYTDASGAGPSSRIPVPTSSNSEAVDAVPQTNEDLDSASQIKEALDTASVTNESADKYCIQLAENVGSGEVLVNSLACSPPHLIQSPPQLEDSVPIRRRSRPWHGWISSDDEEELIHLTPAPLPEQLAKLINDLDG